MILAAPSAPPLGHMCRLSDDVPHVPQDAFPPAQTAEIGAASIKGSMCPTFCIPGHLGHVKSFLSYVRAHTHKSSTGKRAPRAPSALRGDRR